MQTEVPQTDNQPLKAVRCKRLPCTATKAERRELHIVKMKLKAMRRAQLHQLRLQQPLFVLPAWINRHTGKRHDNLREMLRRLAQLGAAA